MLFMILTIQALALQGQATEVLDRASLAFLYDVDRAEDALLLADSAYAAGDFPGAALRYIEALRMDPGDAGGIYNLACCYGLMGEPELAATVLRRAWISGFDDIAHIRQDPDFGLVREHPVFSALLDSLTSVAGDREAALGRDMVFTAEAGFHCRVRTPEGWDGIEPLPLD